MTDVRSKGFSGKAERDQQLVEAGENLSQEAINAPEEGAELDAARREIAWLRKDVEDLRSHLRFIQTQQAPIQVERASDHHSWLRVLTTVAASWALSQVAGRLRLGAVGVAAAPFLAGRLNRWLWN